MKKYPVLLVLSVLLFVLGTADAQQLVLWNKLGSTTEVQNSEIGVNGIIMGTSSFQACQFGNGFVRQQALNDYIKFPSALATANQYTIEFWTSFSGAVPSSISPALPVYMVTYSNFNQTFYGDLRVSSDGQITASLSPTRTTYSVIYRWYGYSWPANEKHHMAFVFDKTASAGNRIKFYFDGVLQTGPTLSMDNTWTCNQAVNVIAGVTMPSFTGSDVTLDNLKIYQGVKTDFSDRFTEGTNTVAVPNIVFWNRLGCAAEVQNSDIGPDGVITGNPPYAPVKFGNGLTSYDDAANTIIFPNALSSPNKGTVEFWWKPNFSSTLSGSETRQLLFFNTPGNTYQFILVYNSGYQSLQAAVWSSLSDPYLYKANYVFQPATFNAGELHHVAMSWDAAAPSNQKLKVYLDGNRIAYSRQGYNFDLHFSEINWTDRFPSVDLWLKLCPSYIFGSEIDNIKIWDEVKTNFSDRNTYDGLDICVGGNTAPAISIVQPDGVSDTADALFNILWTDSDPDNNALISLFYDTDNAGYNGTAIVSGISEDASGSSGSYAWNTSGLANGTYYVYAVINDGVNTAVQSYSPGPVTVYHPPQTNAPAAPSGLQSTAGSEVVNLNWNVVSGAATYNVYRSETNGFTPGPADLVGSVSGHTYSDKTVNNDTRYFYIVTAVNAFGEGLPSNEVWATPGHQQHNLLLKGNKFSASKGEKVTVTYNVTENARVKIRIYDANGSLVDETAEKYLPVGTYNDDWTGLDKTGKTVPPGVYTMQLFVNDELVDTQKTIVTK